MKKKVMLILSCLLLSIGFITAQTTKISGVVIDQQGEPVVGASVVVKGTTNGTVTDIDGKFSINIPSSQETLVFTLVGMKSKEQKATQGMQVTLEEDSKILDEVVVTAMGIKRSEKAIGFSATSVSGDKIAEQRTSDVMSALAGRVAGVQVSSSSGDPGASVSVVIRGFSSLNGSNQPLYVVDGAPLNNSATYSDGLDNSYDFGNGANSINPDDVESMTVLKGAAATALYGSRAANGVILITTKSGSKKTGLGVEYNGGIQFANILKLPEFQNEFGMGWNGDHTLIENGSWGPRMDGSMQLWGNIHNNSQKLKPFSPMKNNVKDFFETGFRYLNNVSYSGATDKSEFFFSFSQLSDDGMLPNDVDTYDRYTFSGRGSHKMGAFKISESVNFSTQKNNFAPTGQGLTMINSLYQIPRDISIVGLRDLNDPFNTPDYYFTPYGVTNPYYLLDATKNQFLADKLFGKVEASYDFLKDFSAIYRLGFDISSNESKIGLPKIVLSPNSPNLAQFTPNPGFAEKTMIRQRELNHEMLFTYNKSLSDFNINGVAGLNINERKYSRLISSVTGLDILGWYNLSNSASPADVSEYESLRRLVGIFAQGELGYKNMAYLTVTARNDWSSTLPKANNSFFYPGVTGSFVFTELLNKDLQDIISFGKVRLAWGQTGNDADVYKIDPYFLQTSTSLGFGDLNFPLNGFNAFTAGNTLGNPYLQPEITTEMEFGTNISFLKRRITLDFAYYDRNSDKQIFALNMDPASGYAYQNVNLGKISNRGIELLLTGRPVETKDLFWDITWNFTKNKSNVESLAEELGGVAYLTGLSSGAGMYAIVGQPLGTFKAEVPERDPNGNIVVDANGLPVAASEQAIIGNMNYDYEMGFSTTVNYKGVSLRGDLDIRHGGIMFSRTKDINYFVGNAIQTAFNDRNTFIVPGSVQKNEAADGTITYSENTTPIETAKIYEYWMNGGDQMGSAFLIDRSYVKLRSVIVGWDLPVKWLRKTFLHAVNFSVYGNNLFVWTPAGNTFIDPEATTFGNDLDGRYGEFSANPSSRQYGFNVRVKF